MTSLKKWRLMAAMAALVVAAPMVISSSGSATAADQNSAANSYGRPDWVGSWATAVTAGEEFPPSSNAFNNQSYRMIVHLSVGGNKVRIRLSNLYGTQNVSVGHATVAKPNATTATLADIDPRTLRQLTFNGKASTTILRGGEVYSDPVDLTVDNLSDLVVTAYFPTSVGRTTYHQLSRQSNFRGPGDLASTTDDPGWVVERDHESYCCWYFLSGVDVLRSGANGTVAVFGASISDGYGTTPNANTKWPSQLAKRLVESGADIAPGVLNVSLAGNRLNHDGTDPAGVFPGFQQLGVNASARLYENVVAQTGIRTAIVELGIDDLWLTGDPADVIIDSLRNIAARLHQRGIRVVLTTILPYGGFNEFPDAWNPQKEATRGAVNAFVRNSRDADGVLDFDALMRDPADPTRLRPEYDSGNHLHPNDLGAKRMADFVPLRMIR
jgi:lysophospholipase L1-like esterase